jgi:undecaprenyl-diphosphatase
MPWVRTANNWIPLYLLLLGYLFYAWGVKAWKWVLLVAVNVALTDQISSSVFKPLFHRLRPCADPQIRFQARLLLDHCSGGFSFTSSHAANHFGLAMFIFMTLQPLFKKYTYLFFVWAACIAYAQVYVGVHYPLDVFAGACIGLVVGYFCAFIYKKWQGNIASVFSSHKPSDF